MSTSSCPSEQEKHKLEREEEVYQNSKILLKQIVLNMCIPDGMTGQFDLAFKVDRQRCIARALRDLGEEFGKEES